MKLPYATAALAGISTVYATSASSQQTDQRKRSLGSLNNASTNITSRRTNSMAAQGRPAVQLKRSNSTVSSADLYANERHPSTASANTPLYATVTPSISSARRNKRQGQFAEREAAGTGCFIPHNDCPGTKSYDTCKGECKPEESGKPASSASKNQCPKCLSKGAIAGIAVGSAVGGVLVTGVVGTGALVSWFRRR